jgi:hypothetical protein
MRYTRQQLLKIAKEMDENWGIFDLIYYWQECGCEDMYKLFHQMSKRDVLWVMEHCFQEYDEKQYLNGVLVRLHRNAYIVLAERLERK